MSGQQGNVDLFLKLGYSAGDVLRVLESLPPGAQTNDILEELIKTCRGGGGAPPGPRPDRVGPQLVGRGCGGSAPTARPGLAPRQEEEERDEAGRLRPIVIDGSNVAMSHGNKQVFSCRGVQLAVKWFWERGHRDVTVFVPLWRKEQARPEAPITDQHILLELEKKKVLVFTPSRCVNGKRVVCYDDRYIVKLACDSDGVIVSNDNYRDLQVEKPQWKKFIEERLLMYTFANDNFMPPDDPLGRNGPAIEDFLRKNPRVPANRRQPCPYGKKCTYGVKCKFHHPERSQSQLSVADELRVKNRLASSRDQLTEARPRSPADGTPPPATAGFYERGGSRRACCSLPAAAAPPPGQEAPPGFSLDSRRETGGPARFRKSPTRPSPDVDEAFESREASLSGLYIQDPGYPTDLSGASSGYGSGFGGPNGNHDGGGNHIVSRAPGGYAHGPYPGSPAPCCCCLRGCVWQRGIPEASNQDSGSSGSSLGLRCQQHLHSSYGEAAPGRDLVYRAEEYGDRQLVEQKRFAPDARPRSPGWGPRGGAGGWGAEAGGISDSRSERRRSTRMQLSTIFPLHAVDYVMGLYPHALDTSELAPLIHTFRSSRARF